MLRAATEIFKMEVPAAGKSAVPTGPTKPLGKKTSQARRSQFNGSIRVLSSPANSEVVRDGIEKRGECVATERSGLPANKVSGIPDAGSGLTARRGRVSAYRKLSRERGFCRTIVSTMSTRIRSPSRSSRIGTHAARFRMIPEKKRVVNTVSNKDSSLAIIWLV